MRWQRCCAPASPQSNLKCDEILDRNEAVQLFAVERRCTENAVDTLERFAAADGDALNDLAAAYSVRAREQDRPSDLLRALDAVSRAPQSPESRFNLALMQEAVGLRDEAIASWSAVLDERSDWRGEAREHLERLQRERGRDVRLQWQRNRRQILDELPKRNAAAIAKLIEPFPRQALQLYEDEVLPAANDAEIALYADVLAGRLGNSPYVRALADAAPANRAAYRLFAEARRADYAKKPSLNLYIEASRLLRAARNPLYLEAEMARGVLTAALPEGLSTLNAIEREVRETKDDYLLALFLVARGYVLFRQTQYVQSNQDCDEASKIFERVRDEHSLASLYRTTAGNYRLMAQYELASRDALKATHYARHSPDTRIRHTVHGEQAAVARALGYPRIALQFQESAVEVIRSELAGTPPERVDRIETLLRELSSALRERARIEFDLRLFGDANRDLAEAIRLSRTTAAIDVHNQSALTALAAEVEGQTLLRFNPSAAVAAFTRAIEGVGADELRTFRASLFAQRAAAQRILKRDDEAERDLQTSLRELGIEETRLLQQRTRGEGEQVWPSYFARFKATYDMLVTQLAAQKRVAEAFFYAERARAFEPLQLVLQLEFVPDEFRELVKNGQPIPIDGIQAALPPGTFLLEYTVTEDRTFVWIISTTTVKLLELPVPAKDVQRWTEDLQSAGRRRDLSAFHQGLAAPFDKLLARALAEIREPVERLVIIPDGAMNGLPFAALRDPVTRRYLLELAPIESAGSATLYVFSLLRDRALKGSGASTLLIGDPAFDPKLPFTRGLRPLPYARREVEKIRTYYDHADTVTGEDATVPAFLRLARDKSIVHFAGHAIVNPREPSRSLLLLAPSDGHRGAMEAQELLTQLDLRRTRLVFLSTCSSAGGFPVGPEGVAPLVRPLIAAGVPGVVGSLWDVDDATAEQLSVSFHRRFEQGDDAAKALQAAQLEMLRSGSRGLQLVLSWAPFQVIGHASSPFEPADKRLNGGTRLGIHRTHSLHRDDGLRPAQ